MRRNDIDTNLRVKNKYPEKLWVFTLCLGCDRISFSKEVQYLYCDRVFLLIYNLTISMEGVPRPQVRCKNFEETSLIYKWQSEEVPEKQFSITNLDQAKVVFKN